MKKIKSLKSTMNKSNSGKEGTLRGPNSKRIFDDSWMHDDVMNQEEIPCLLCHDAFAIVHNLCSQCFFKMMEESANRP